MEQRRVGGFGVKPEFVQLLAVVHSCTRIRGMEISMKARGRATGVASGARTGDPHGNHLHPKWSSVPPDHLGHQVTNKRGPPEVDRALGLDGRTGMVYWGDAKHEQASSLSHERGWPPPRRAKRKEKITPMSYHKALFDLSNARKR